MDTVSVLSLAVGLLTVTLVAFALARMIAGGGLPRNSVVGIRTAATTSSDGAWEVGHRQAVPGLKRAAVAGWAFLGLAVILLVLGMNTEAFVVTAAGFIVSYTLLGVASYRAHRAAKDYAQTQQVAP